MAKSGNGACSPAGEMELLIIFSDSFTEYHSRSSMKLINETDQSQEVSGEKRVKARVSRNVDGLDTYLFEKALEVRRAFLADPAYAVQQEQQDR